MIDEARRRLYLGAMQVASWLPRTTLPFAAPARPLWQPEDEIEASAPMLAAPLESPPVSDDEPPPLGSTMPVAVAPSAPRPRVEVPRPAAQARQAAVTDAANDGGERAVAKVKPLPPPRFSLQLLRAGSCAVLVELPNGEVFSRRDPAYLLLRDLLRAAGLPDSPQIIGEPVRWPLLVRGSLEQGPQAALEYVQSFVAARLEEQGGCVCLWLLGLPAIRFAGEGDAEAYNRELQIDGLGSAWAMPGLELLMDEPHRKAELWQAMRRLMPRWKAQNE